MATLYELRHKYLGNFWTLIVVYTLCTCLESINFSLIVTSVQSIERQFQISSKRSGILFSSHRFGYIATVIIISHFASRGNRARWIGIGSLLIAAGSLLMSLPYFIFQDQTPAIEQKIFSALNGTFLGGKAGAGAGAGAGAEIPYLNGSWNGTFEEFEEFGRSKGAGAEFNKELQRMTQMAFGYCDPQVNEVRKSIEDMKCENQEDNTVAEGLIILAMVLFGIGSTVPWTLGIPLLDDNIKKKKLPLYLAGIRFIRILGPMAGYFIGGLLTDVYYNFRAPEGMTKKNPRWIGAWWLGFLIVFSTLTIPSIILTLFPAEVSRPKHQKKRGKIEKAVDEEEKEKMIDSSQKKSNKKQELKEVLESQAKSFLPAIVEILKCPIYSMNLLGNLFDSFAFRGYSMFLPKFISNQYGLSQAKSNIIIGTVSTCIFALGNLIGGYFTKRLHLNGRKAAFYVALISWFSVFAAFSRNFLSCHSVVNSVGRVGKEVNFNFTASCNIDCKCDDVKLYPVCGRDGTPFFSPCAAGCRNFTSGPKKGEFNFSDCACADGGSVSEDWCVDDCNTPTIIYAALMILGSFLGGTASIPGSLISLRSVPPKHRSLAMAFSSFLRSIASLPSPIVYGALIDGTCLLWDYTCGKQGSCSIYEPFQFLIRLHVMQASLRIIGAIFDIVVFYFAKDLKLLEEIDEEPEKEKEKEKEKLEIPLAEVTADEKTEKVPPKPESG